MTIVVIAPCPEWCQDRSPAHRRAYDTVDDRAMVRTHSLDIGSATIVQDERCQDGNVTLMPAAIHSYVVEFEDLTAADARQAAADFLAAADKLEEITA